MGLRFIDLFAGLGGFHEALSSLGHRCVFACEINDELARIYEKNFGIQPFADIRKLDLRNVPPHDILCAGFPCQPFSKAGEQQGLDCPTSGDLIKYVIEVLQLHQPEFFILENVPNLVHHNSGQTLRAIEDGLRKAGYATDMKKLSPHQFGVPQIRERAFIVGRRGSLGEFKWPEPFRDTKLSVSQVLDRNPPDARPLPKQYIEYLEAWQEFIKKFPKRKELPSFPIWAMEFGATYPYEESTPYSMSPSKLRKYRGALGIALDGLPKEELLEYLPAYARDTRTRFPKWKIDFIRQNRYLYAENKAWIDRWLPTIANYHASFQKFEWNCKGETRDLWRYVIQFRASGIRVKRPTTAPSLVAMTTSQVPIIAWEKRYMTAKECSRLQSLGALRHLPSSSNAAYKALGNAVNATVVKEIASRLLLVQSKTLPRRRRAAMHGAFVP